MASLCTNLGLLTCDFCKRVSTIQEENFPADLFKLMIKYNISQLMWLCIQCKQKKEENFVYYLSLAERQREMEKMINTMAVAINQVQSAVHSSLNDEKFSSGNLLGDLNTDKSKISGRNQPGDVDTHRPSSMLRSGWEFVDSPTITSSRSQNFDASSISSGMSIKTISTLQDDAAKTFITSPSQVNIGKKSLGIFKEILSKKIKIDDNEVSESKATVTEFVDKMVKILKERSPEFEQLFLRTYYTGSSYENLRIEKANEFDLDFILKFPLQKTALKVEFPEEYPSFAKCALVTEEYKCSPLLKLFFDNGYLIPSKVISWMQSLISKFVLVESFALPAKVVKVTLSKSGPANTITLYTAGENEIDIDFVPVLNFSDPEYPPLYDTSLLRNMELSSEDKFWFLVPKPFVPSGACTPSIEDHKLLWRIHFPEVEKKFLLDKGCAKPIIKLLKLLRDKKENNWKSLASYYLKTVVMWEIQKNPSDAYWKETRMGERFLEVLKNLKEYVKDGKLPHILYPQVNLFQKMNSDHLRNIDGRLKNIIKEIEKDYTNLRTVFALPSTL